MRRLGSFSSCSESPWMICAVNHCSQPVKWCWTDLCVAALASATTYLIIDCARRNQDWTPLHGLIHVALEWTMFGRLFSVGCTTSVQIPLEISIPGSLVSNLGWFDHERWHSIYWFSQVLRHGDHEENMQRSEGETDELLYSAMQWAQPSSRLESVLVQTKSENAPSFPWCGSTAWDYVADNTSAIARYIVAPAIHQAFNAIHQDLIGGKWNCHSNYFTLISIWKGNPVLMGFGSLWLDCCLDSWLYDAMAVLGSSIWCG